METVKCCYNCEHCIRLNYGTELFCNKENKSLSVKPYYCCNDWKKGFILINDNYIEIYWDLLNKLENLIICSNQSDKETNLFKKLTNIYNDALKWPERAEQKL